MLIPPAHLTGLARFTTTVEAFDRHGVSVTEDVNKIDTFQAIAEATAGLLLSLDLRSLLTQGTFYAFPIHPRARKFVAIVTREEDEEYREVSHARMYVENDEGELNLVAGKKAEDTFQAMLALCNEMSHLSWMAVEE